MHGLTPGGKKSLTPQRNDSTIIIIMIINATYSMQGLERHVGV